MARRALKITAVAIRHAWPVLLLLVWLAAHLSMPFSSYYRLGEIDVGPDPALQGNVKLEYNGGAIRPFLGKYSVTVRRFENNEIACEAGSAPFLYDPNSVRPDPLTMAWWAPSDPRCASLPPDVYTMQTCWTVTSRGPLGILPNITKCLSTPIFRVA